MEFKTEAAQTIGAVSVYALANKVDHHCSNDETRAFYENLRDALAEEVDYYAGGERPDDDRLSEIADSAFDVYKYTRMLEVIGTGAYLDTSNLATGDEDMVTLAGYLLYDLAHECIAALLDEAGL